MAEIEQTVITKDRMVVAISEKRCGYYTHPCQSEYKMKQKGNIYSKNEGENQKSPKHSPGR